MEPRNREARRGVAAGGGAASALRRPRANGHKDASDEDEKMDEASDSKPWERPKKEKTNSFHVSGLTNSCNKRKRHGRQDLQAQGRSSVCDDAEESAEDTEIPVSEDDDEPPPPPPHRRPGKSRGNGRVKGEDAVMDIRTVPRKARSLISSCSRFSSNVRRPQECLLADASQQESPVSPHTSLNGVSASSLLGGKPGRKMKSTGTKIKAMKASHANRLSDDNAGEFGQPTRVTEPTTISDQEVEVAEVLFDLARSMPSRAGSLESNFERKIDSNSENEGGRAVSPPLLPARSPPHVVTPTSGPGSLVLQTTVNAGDRRNTLPQLQSVVVTAAEAPKRKRPRHVTRQEEGRATTSSQMVVPSGGSHSSSPSGVINSPVGDSEQASKAEKSLAVATEGPCLQLESMKADVTVDSPLLAPELHAVEDTKINGVEHHDARDVEEKQDNQNSSERMSGCSHSVALNPTHLKAECSANISVKDAITELSSRPSELFHDIDDNAGKLGIDLMVPPVKVSLKEADSQVSADDSLADTSITVRSYPAEDDPQIKVELSNEGCKDKEDLSIGVKKELEENVTTHERASTNNQEQKKEHEEQTPDQHFREGIACQVKTDGTKDQEAETEKVSARIPTTKIQKADPGTPSAPSLLPSTFSTDVSSSTAVALAGWMGPLGYYGSGAPPWPAGASLPRSNLDGKTSHPVMQLPHAASLPSVPRMKRCTTHVYIAHYIYFEQQRSRHTLWPATLCRGAPYNLNIPAMGIDKGKMCGTYMDLARKPGSAYGYSVSQPNGPGIPATGGSIGNDTTGNAISALSHTTVGGISVESLAGATTGSVVNMTAPAQYLHPVMPNGFAPFSFPFNGPPGQAAQYFNNPFYPAHLVPPIPHLQSMAQPASNLLPVPKQQQVPHMLPNSSSSQLLQPQQQQQLQLQLAPQSPSHSQQHQHNMGASNQHFGYSEKDSIASESQFTAESRLPAVQRRGKQTGKPQQQTHIQVQQPASLSPSVQQHQQQQVISQNSGPASGLQIKGPDKLVSQPFAPMTLPSMNRGSVGPGPLGLVPVAAVMAAQGHALLSGSSEGTKIHAHQQQSYGVHNQQYHQRAMPGAGASVNEDTFAPSTNKGMDIVEEKKSLVRQGGCPSSNLSRADIEVSSSAVLSSSTGGSGAATARLVNNAGRTLNVASSTSTRNGRSATGTGNGQAAQLQNQTLKQSMPCPKIISGTGIPPTSTPSTIPLYLERASHPGNLGKIPGTVLPFPSQVASCSQGSKQGQSCAVRIGQKPSQGPGLSTSGGISPQVMLSSAVSKSSGQQQARNNQQGTTINAVSHRMAPSVSAPVLSSGAHTLSTSHSPPVLKAGGVGASKSPSNGKGLATATKSGSASVKRSPVSGPIISSVISGQNMPAKASSQQRSQAQVPPSHLLPQHLTTQGQQQQLGPKQQVCHQQPQQGSSSKQSFSAQPQYRFLQQHNQQYLQPSPLQQQVFPQQTQQPSPHYFQQHLNNSSLQHGHSQQSHLHSQQQLQSIPSSSSATTISGLSLSPPNLTLGTGLPGITGGTTSDGADEFHGPGSRLTPQPKTVHSPGSQMPSVLSHKSNIALLSANAVVSGPQQTDSSHYLQLAPVLGVKPPVDQKSSSESVNWEQRNNVRHPPSSSSSQPPLIANPTSS